MIDTVATCRSLYRGLSYRSFAPIAPEDETRQETLDTFRLLCDFGLDPRGKDSTFRSCVYYAISSRQLRLLKALVDRESQILSQYDVLYLRPLFWILTSRSDCCRRLPQTGEVRRLVSSGCNEVDHTPLVVAIASGDLKMVELLVDLGANVNQTSPVPSSVWSTSTHSEGTPLTIARHMQREEIAVALVKRGAVEN